jgi:hypothetical protein
VSTECSNEGQYLDKRPCKNVHLTFSISFSVKNALSFGFSSAGFESPQPISVNQEQSKLSSMRLHSDFSREFEVIRCELTTAQRAMGGFKVVSLVICYLPLHSDVNLPCRITNRTPSHKPSRGFDYFGHLRNRTMTDKKIQDHESSLFYSLIGRDRERFTTIENRWDIRIVT